MVEQLEVPMSHTQVALAGFRRAQLPLSTQPVMSRLLEAAVLPEELPGAV
jgi:hypothetical protein